MKTIQFVTLRLIVCMLLVGCTQVNAAAPSFPGGAPQAWIDAPLNLMVLELSKPYEIIFHITDDVSVVKGELVINGVQIAILDNPHSGSKLATLRYMWTPTEPGLYTIQARAQGSSGNWGDYATVQVTVGAPTPSFTPTPTFTNTPTKTQIPTRTRISTMTRTPTNTRTPTPIYIPESLEFSPSASTSQFYYGTCGEDSVTLSVQLNSTSNVQAVELFVRLNGNSGGRTEWNSYNSMKSKGNGLFQITVRSREIPGADQFDSATLMYQFIATGSGGSIIGRSETYGDVTLTKCGTIIYEILPQPQLQLYMTPTPTHQIIK